MTEPLLTYGLSPEGLKFILEVENGLACNCVCSKCKSPLVARNNPLNKNQPHFAHNSENNCVGAYESTLHELFKEVFREIKKIRVPDFHFDYDSYNDDSKFRTGEIIDFDMVSVEERIPVDEYRFIVADNVGYIKNKKLIIEFAKSHFVDPYKRDKILELNTPCIEIDLKNQILDRNSIKAFLIEESFEIYWIYNPKLDNEYKKHLDAKEKEDLENQRIADIEKQQNQEIAKRLSEISEIKKIEQESLNSKRQAERLLKLENEIFELELADRTKYENYKAGGQFKFISLYGGSARKCPILVNDLNKLKNNRKLYQHPILRLIIDGEFWNGELYGKRPFGTYIFLKKEKIVVYPPSRERHLMTSEEEEKANQFWSGLKTVEKILLEKGNCSGCKFNIDCLSFESKNLSVCNYQIA